MYLIMEITKKMIRVKKVLILCVTIPFLLCCHKTEEQSLYIYRQDLKKEKKICFNDAIQIKKNIYKYKGKLYMAFEHFKTTYEKDIIINKKDGLVLFDTINHYGIEELIDLNSYVELKAYFLYKDKFNVYLYPREDCRNYCMKILDANPITFKVLDDNYEYASDQNKVYCLRYGNQINTISPKKFISINLNQITFGIDSTHIYSMCEAMTPSYFKNNFESHAWY